MLLRKARRASNTWYRLGRPLIPSGEMAGQHDQERIVVSIQIVPEGSFDEYGDRKVTGFMLSEITEMVETGKGKTLYGNVDDNTESVAFARISIGDGMNQVTITELKQILEAMGGKILSTPSPMDNKDLARLRALKDPEVKVVVVPGQMGPLPPEEFPSDTLGIEAKEAENADISGADPDEPSDVGPTDSEDDGTDTGPE